MCPFVQPFVLILFLTTLHVPAQAGDPIDGKAGGTLRGVARTASGQPVPFIRLTIRDLTKSATANEDGIFILKGIPAGQHTLLASGVGLQLLEQTVSIADGQSTEVNLIVTESGQVSRRSICR